MATPRKYPTLAEFEELKEAVGRLEARLGPKAERASVWIDADELADRLGLADAYGVPVAVGDEISPMDRDDPRKVVEASIRAAARSGKATMTVRTGNGQTVTAVDMRLPGHVVTKKATA
ncbi:hypothetical protein B5F40_01635 [Gordonibacter sp. An230]|uniref:hypothetical protein n=1 Tax=Gordonibacter sp. An230 TaxID=1965592 RepID=UPI000B38210A|nr:hypothetical protein [Gordonibacter sp. An230]OUO92061.1 hypothetical protein B5F40_01635 [Gordonibacter sp. An230]